MTHFASTHRVFMSVLCAAALACDDAETTPGGNDAPDGQVALPDGSVAFDAGPVLPVPDASSPVVDGGGGSDGGVNADTGTPGGDAATGDAGADSGVPALKPKCVKKDSQVMVIGDSFINWLSHEFPTQLKTATKQDWRMLAVGGTAMGSGGIGRIPDQFFNSIAQDPDAHTLLMDGGGNDVLVPDLALDALGECREAGSSTKPNCQKIVKTALDTASELLDKAVAAGIRDVVYFFYPHIPENRLIGGPKPNEILDYSLPMVKSFCDGVEEKTDGKLRCHFIDMIPVFKGHTPGLDPGITAGSEADWFNEDIHPNPKGSQGMVDKVWSLMKERCIGQKDADCCEK